MALDISTKELRENFKKYYDENLAEEVDKMNKKRSFYFSTIFYSFIGIVITNLLLASFIQDEDLIPAIVVGSVILFISETVILAFKIKEKLKSSELLEKFIKYFDGFQFKTPYNGVIIKDYDYYINDITMSRSKIVDHYDKVETDDEIFGNYKGVNLMISEKNLLVENMVVVTDSNGHIRTEKVIEYVFNGIMILIDMNKAFKDQIIIKNKKMFNNFSKGAKEIIKLEDPEFTKLFDVYSNDQIESRYVLTTGFIDRFKELIKIFKTKQIRASFFDNRLFITIYSTRNMFEFGGLFSKVDYETVLSVLDDILGVLKIVEVLKLNDKIGL